MSSMTSPKYSRISVRRLTSSSRAVYCSICPIPLECHRSRTGEGLFENQRLPNPLDFSSRSLKHWLQHFDILFNKKFITERIARIAIMYNSCSLPLQQQILSMNVGSRAEREDFKFQDFLQILSVLCNSESTRPVETASRSTSRRLEALRRMLTGSLQHGPLTVGPPEGCQLSQK